MSAPSKIHGRLRLLSGMTFDNNADIVAENGLLATLNGMPCVYTTIDGVEAWFPLAKGVDNKTYKHTQIAESSMWTVTHNLGTEDVWFIIRDGDGDIVATTLGIEYDAVDPTNKLIFHFAVPISGSVFIIGTNAFSSPILNTGTINLGEGVSIDNNGITVNGQVILLTDLAADSAAIDAIQASQAGIVSDIDALQLTVADLDTNAVRSSQLVSNGGSIPELVGGKIAESTLPEALAKTNVRQNWDKSQIGDIVALAFASEISLDLALSNNFSLTMTGNATLSLPTNIAPGQGGILVVTQDATGGRVMSFNSIFKFAGGTVPALSVAGNAVDYLCYFVESANRIMVTQLKDVR